MKSLMPVTQINTAFGLVIAAFNYMFACKKLLNVPQVPSLNLFLNK